MSLSQQLQIKQALSKAQKAIKQGNDTLALQLYQKVLEHKPNHPVARKAVHKIQKVQSQKGHTNNPPQEQVNSLLKLYDSGLISKVEQLCKELHQTYPLSLIVIDILAMAQLRQGKLQEAAHSLDKVLQLKPDYAEAYCNRANVLKDLGCIDDALSGYNKAIQLKPDYAEAYYNRGNLFKDIGQVDEAILCYDKALQLKPDYIKVYCNRGNLLLSLGQVNEARESYDMAIQHKPDYVEAHRSLSSLINYTFNDPQIKLMEALYTRLDPSSPQRSQLCFALAKVYDDLGDNTKSFNFLEEGNRLRKNELNYKIEDDRALIAKVKEVFVQEVPTLDTSTNSTSSICPIFIIGMPRSGTSLVEQIIASHSRVYGAGELEAMTNLVMPILTNLPEDTTNQSASILQMDHVKSIYDGYLDVLTALKVPEKIFTDKMPLNFRWIGFIISAFPHAKIVHISRDPVAICWSNYKHYFSTIGNGYAYDMGDLSEFYTLYTDLMTFWKKLFPDTIYDLSYEHLTENQEAEIRRLLEYCDLEFEEQCLDFHKTKRLVKTASATQVRKKMYKGSSDAWRRYQEYLQPLINSLTKLK